jgi:hypothetical protein
MAIDAAGHARLTALIDSLIAERQGVLEGLSGIDPRLMSTPGLAGEWSAKDLVAHLGYWTGHATEAVHHAEDGRLAEYGSEPIDVDAINEVVAKVSRETDLATVRAREEAAFETLVARLRQADPSWLDERTAYGDTLEQVLNDDAVQHYREHALDIRSWFAAGDEADDDEADDDEADDDEADDD